MARQWRKLANSVEVWRVFVFHVRVVLFGTHHLGADVWEPSQEHLMPISIEVGTWSDDAPETPTVHLC